MAGMQVVTPDKPEATDSVVYKELGKIIPVDTFGNQSRMQNQFIMLMILRCYAGLLKHQL